ncbi:MAG TPA: aspartate kinase [Gammaproteobacteria bacterium]|nr:aspartate kinase [Gammaproteobacteria bacterium]
MSLIVQKYGGTSVATVAHLDNVARRIIATQAKGHDVVVVVSAMGHETDRLDDLARQVGITPETHREVDVLLSTGEQVTTALLSMVLANHGCRARSYTGGQIKILTDSAHTKARILDIECERLQADLDSGVVAVVAGFQGVDENGNITTMGRGGSDTTAVAMAAALEADECRIYTDVDGVYTADPRIVKNAQRLDSITYEEMLEMASLGSKVLQIRSVEFARKYNVNLRVLSSFEDGLGTLITDEDENMEAPLISGIAHNRDEAKLTIVGVPDMPGVASQILGPIADVNIEVDMIVQNMGLDNSTDFTFTVHRSDYDKALSVLQKTAKDIGAKGVSGDNTIVKISVVGVGMRSHAGIANTMFKALANENINIQMISTSEIKISVVVTEKHLELGVCTLHTTFGLDNEKVL